MVEILKALSVESRLRILALLMEREMCVCEIEVILKMTQSNASRHLLALKNCGILNSYKNAQWTYYQISEEFKSEQSELWEYLKNNIVKLPTYQADLDQYEKYKTIDVCSLMDKKKSIKIGFFQKYLTIWVTLCMISGVLIGKFLPAVPSFFAQFEYANVSIPTAILIWIMIYPMMMKVNFQSVKNVGKNPKGLYVTWITNWLIKPFTMFAIASFFFYVVFSGLIPAELGKEYLAGAVLLGAAPCTAMVFVWSQLTKGNPAYTVVQVATNDLIILVAFVPIVKFLLGVSKVSVPWDTLILSVVLFVVVPLTAGVITRLHVSKRKGVEYFENHFLPMFNNATIVGLLLMLILLFSFQGDVIINNPLHILLIAVPLTIQTFLIFFIAYMAARVLKLPHDIAAPAGMIGASNFFELSVAVAIALFGMDSPAALATVVGVLTEVPIMLILVMIANKTTNWFPEA